MSIKIMLDSGAFSAWTRNKVIDLDGYIKFIKRFEDDLESYVNLDVIPGKPGSKPTAEEVDFSANAGWENYQKMLDSGLNPIPVFHFGEDIKWLEKMIDSGVDYIGLGGVVGRPRPLVKKWLDMVFDMITDDEGYPIVKTHGFGITANWSIVRYPWYSVDSISWRIQAAYGFLRLPYYDLRTKTFTYENPVYIFVSKKSPSRFKLGAHIDTVDSHTKKMCCDYLETLDVNLEEIQDNPGKLAECNGIYFCSMAAAVGVDLFKGKSSNKFFGGKKLDKVKEKCVSSTIMYLGISSNTDAVKISNVVTNPAVLISYAALPKSIQDDYFKRCSITMVKEKISE